MTAVWIVSQVEDLANGQTVEYRDSVWASALGAELRRDELHLAGLEYGHRWRVEREDVLE